MGQVCAAAARVPSEMEVDGVKGRAGEVLCGGVRAVRRGGARMGEVDRDVCFERPLRFCAVVVRAVVLAWEK